MAADEEGKVVLKDCFMEPITDLFHKSPLVGIVESLIGKDMIQRIGGGQIALRFPQMGEPKDPSGKGWHIDGMGKGRVIYSILFNANFH